MAGNFRVIEEPIDQAAYVVAISGELDTGAAPAFKEHIMLSVARGQPVVLDLSDVVFLDSHCVAVLFAARKEVPLTRENFAIVCQGEIRRMFGFTGLDVAFDVVETRAEALGHLVATA